MSTGFGAAVRPKAASRNSVGVQPQRRRKNRLKWQMLRKPEAAAACCTDRELLASR